MSIRRRLIEDERGISFAIVVLLAGVLTLLSVSMIDVVRGDSSRSADSVQQQASFAAAEAGINDYIAKLVDDPLYYTHYVHAGEATRRASGGQTVPAGGTWSYGITPAWTYPNGKDKWYTGSSGNPLADGYEYDLEITPPSASQTAIQIVATGRKTGSTTNQRVIQVLVRSSSISDFQFISASDANYGVGATTYGKVYASGNITHSGTAQASLYAEGSITGGVAMQNGATQYTPSTNPSIRTVIKSPINFSSFLTSLTDISRASQNGGVNINDVSKTAWRLIFSSNGTFTSQACTGSDGTSTQPTCSGTITTYNVPSNGAVYVGQTALVSGVVNGRVTVASGNNIIVENNISYNDGHCANQSLAADDVLGLDAQNNVLLAAWGPSSITWCASVLAQTGSWGCSPGTVNSPPGNCPSGGHSTMNFTGSAAVTVSGNFSGMYTTRNYYYDNALLYLLPPWFPAVGDAYTVSLFRELPGS